MKSAENGKVNRPGRSEHHVQGPRNKRDYGVNSDPAAEQNDRSSIWDERL